MFLDVSSHTFAVSEQNIDFDKQHLPSPALQKFCCVKQCIVVTEENQTLPSLSLGKIILYIVSSQHPPPPSSSWHTFKAI